MEDVPKENRHFMLQALEIISLVVSHPKTPILNCLYYLLWFYFLTVSEFSCLAKS